MAVNDSVASEVDNAQSGSAAPQQTTMEETSVEQNTAAVEENPFDRDELIQFDADDSHAASVIGKMLAIFFAILLFLMLIVGYWTSGAIAP